MSASGPSALWCFDLGNTSLKGRWSRGAAVGAGIVVDWALADVARRLREALADWPQPARVLVASVASAGRAQHLRDALQRWPGIPVEWLASPRHACGITNAYRVPARLGIDRFLALAGAYAMQRGALVVVGCGTALTLDALDAGGRQQAGLIVPSPDLMVRTLQRATAIAVTNPDAFGDAAVDDTHKAIQAGCWHAAVALVAMYSAQQRQRFGEIAVWLHGGGAATLKAALEATAGGGAPARILEDAVWRGMEVWAQAARTAVVVP